MTKTRYNGVPAALLAAFVLLAPGAAAAMEPEAPDAKTLLTPEFVEQLRKVVQHEIVQLTVNGQNGRHKTITQADIDALDKKWRAERKEQVQPLVAAVLNNPLSTYLTQIQAASGGLLTEIFVVDNKGLNVGQSAITSDYWQGDEGKFQKTFPVGADAVFIDAAPVTLYPDARALAPLVDGVVLVVEADITPVSVAARAVDLIRDSGANILGVVLNKRHDYIPERVLQLIG